MDEQYIKDLYDQLGGQDRFGEFTDFQEMISSDTNYQKHFHSEIGEDVLGNFDDFVSLVKKKGTPYQLQGQVNMSQPVSNAAQSGSGNLQNELAIEPPKEVFNPFLEAPQSNQYNLPGQVDMNEPQSIMSLRARYLKAVDDGMSEELVNKYYRTYREAVHKKNSTPDITLIDKPTEIKPGKIEGLINPIRKEDEDKRAREVITRFHEEITGKRENQGVVGEMVEDAKQIMPSFNKGVISTLTSIPKGVSILAKGIDDLLGTRNEPIENYNMYQLGQWIDKKAEEIGMTALDEKRLGFGNSTLPMAFGSMMGMVLTGGGTPKSPSPFIQQSVARQSLNMLTSPIAMTGGLQSAVPEYEAAKRAGASDEEAFSVFFKNIPGGMTEVLPIANMFTRLNKMTNSGLLNILKEGTAQGLEEASQEAVQQYLTNKIAQGSYDPKRDLKEGLLEGAGAGFIVGFIMPGAMNAMANMTAEQREETKQILANAIKVDKVTPTKFERRVVAPTGDLGKPQSNENKTGQTGKGNSAPLPENIQKESVQVQAEVKKAEEEKINEPTGEAVKEEVRQPVQPIEETPAEPTVEEPVKPRESAVEATKVGFKELTPKEQKELPAWKQGKVISGEDGRLSELDLSEGDQVVNSYDGKVYTVKPTGEKNKNTKYDEYELTDSEGNTSIESERPIFQKVQSESGQNLSKVKQAVDEINDLFENGVKTNPLTPQPDLKVGDEVIYKGKKSKIYKFVNDITVRLDNGEETNVNNIQKPKSNYTIKVKKLQDDGSTKTVQQEVEGKPYKKYPTLGLFSHPSVNTEGYYSISEPSGNQVVQAKTKKEAEEKIDELVTRYGGEEGFKKAMDEQIAKMSAKEEPKENSDDKVKKFSNKEVHQIIRNSPTENKKYLGDLISSSEVKVEGGQAFQDVYDGGTIQRIVSDDGSKVQRLIDDQGSILGIPMINLTMNAKEANTLFKGKDSFELSEKEITNFFNNKFSQKPTIKEIADESKGQVIIAKPGAAEPETFGKGFKVIGKNNEGNKVGEDKNGVRAVLKGNIVLSQPVQIVPGGGYFTDKTDGQFLTKEEAKAQADEIAQKYGFESPSQLINSVKKRTGDQYENVQDIPKDVIEKVRNERELEQLTPKEDEQAGTVANQGSSGTSGDTAELNAPIEEGGTEQGEPSGSKSANGTVGETTKPQSGDVRTNRNEPAGSTERGAEGRIRPELKDTDLQHNFLYPYNWERTKNKTFSKRQAYADNIAALEVINSLLDNPDTFATEEQKEILSRYNGLGPLGEILLSDNKLGSDWTKSNVEFFDDAQRLKSLLQQIGEKTGTRPLDTAKSSTRNAYYTALPIIRSIYEGLEAGGFTGGKILEGSVGSGRFIGGMPASMMANSRIKGVDMDVVSALISKYLYPKASILNSPLQSASIPSNYYDLFISNIPFGSAKVYDPQLDKRGGLWKQAQDKLHTYFFAKAIDSVRPGGYVAILTTSNILDTPGNQGTRDLINKETDFVGAVRLSSTAFNADAGTQVVTDIILLRKKTQNQHVAKELAEDVFPFLKNKSWEQSSQISNIVTQKVKHNNPALPDQDIQYNEYFKKNPSHIFGTEFKAGGLYNAERGYTLVGEFDPAEVGKKLSELAAKMPILERQVTEKDALETLQISPLGRMVSGGIVEEKGKYYQVQNFDKDTGKYNIEEIAKSVMPAEKDMPILKAFVETKKQYFDILAKDKIGEDATKERTQLKKQLKDFIKTIKPYANINSLAKGTKAINRLLQSDPDFYAISALEKSDGSFSDVVEKPIRRELNEFSKTDVPQEAIGFSLNNYGKINLPFIQKVLGEKSEESTIERIKNEIFETPDEVIEKTEYLSGNVVEKLKQAQDWAKVDEKYKRNVEALKKVIPEPIPKDKITFQLGASWIPIKYTQQFLDSVFGEGRVTVRYNKATDDYEVTSRVVGGDYEAFDPDGHRKGVDVVVKAAITKNVPDFYLTHSDGTKTPLPKLTQDVRDKAERLQGEFAGLIEADEKTGDELAKLYNEYFNGVVIKKFNGDHLTFPGMQGHDLNPHQKDAIMLLVQKMGGMVDHIVGAGKTLVMTVGAIKMKQMGLINKPMITTMKSVVPGMLDQIKQQYPEARILAPSEKDFAAANRQKLFAQIANNDWDLVIISHENLGTIPLPPEFESQYIEGEIEELRSAMAEMNADKSDKWAVKQAKALEERIANLRSRLEKLQDKGASASRTDFGTMGVDMLFVDESQQFKNLNFVTKLRNVAGLGTAKGSKRASNLKMVSRYLQNMHGGDKGIVFASGTPISNSLVEVYNIFQYMRPSLLKKLQMVSLDQFLKNFALISSQMEKNVAGVIKNKTRLNKFVNVPELASLYSEISDIRGEHNLKLPRPDIKGGKPEIILIPQSETVRMITNAIFNASKGNSVGPLRDIGINPKGDAEKALGLVLTTLGTKASIDPRLVFPTIKADGGKIFKVAEEVSKIYDEEEKNKGVQLVFADMGTPKNKNAKLGDRVKDQVIEMYGEDVLTEIARTEEIWKQTETSDIKQKLMEILEISPEEADMIVEEANNLTSFNVYEALKNELVKKGIPDKEIAFIHDAPTKKLKEELFDKVNEGKVRVLIGSTMKMGTGVNVQKRIAAMHHIDVGWRPSDLEQRNGRGIRRGNLYKEVAIKYYGTEETIDAYRFDLLARKQSGIDSFRAGAKGLREMDFEDGESMTMSEFAAAISGDTRILDLEKLKSKEQKLRNRVDSIKRANLMRQKRINDAKASVEYARNARKIVNDLAERIKANAKLEELEEEEIDDKGKAKKVKKVVAVFKGEVDGQSFDTRDPKQREKFYKALAENANAGIKRGYREVVGTIGGIDIYAKQNNSYKDGRIDLGEETVGGDVSPISLIKQTSSVTPVTIRTAINATIRDINIDINIFEKNYKEALSNLAAQESAKEVHVKEEDVKELAETEAKRKKLSDQLKAESENKAPEEQQEPSSLENIISEASKQNTSENFENFSGAMSVGIPLTPVGKVKKAPSDNALLAMAAQANMTKEQLENELKEQLKVGDEEVDKRIEEASKPSESNVDKSWMSAVSGVKNWMTQHFKHLNANKFPREANILREFETLSPWAKNVASQYIKTLVDGMTPNQYKVFSMRIILADMLESIQKGLNMTGPDGKLPFGFKDADQVERQLTKYDLFMKGDPKILRAFEAREAFMKEFKNQLVEAGLMDDTDIDSYYHRRVLEYHAERDHMDILFGKDIADVKRNFQKRRKGTRGLDYSTNFLETEWKVVSEGLYEVEKQKVLKDLMNPYEKQLTELVNLFNQNFETKLAEMGKTFGEDSEEYARYKKGKKQLKANFLLENLPEGYVFYRVSDENRLFWGKTVTQKTLDRAIEEAESLDNSGVGQAMSIVQDLVSSLGRGLMVGPKRKQYMVPKELASQLDEMASDKTISQPTKLAMMFTSAWKQLMLLSPTRVLRYNINNLASDIDRVIQVDPQILKYSKESFQELWRHMKYGETTPQLLEAMRGDVINSGFQISELADVNEQAWAKALLDKNVTVETLVGKNNIKKLVVKMKDAPGNLWEKYMSVVSPYVQFRENVLRYAAYKLATEKTAKGEVFYWASPANQIREIKDVRQRNARLARDAFGDYMNLSQAAHDMRRVLAPFYSWFEVNMKTHYNLLKNASSYQTQKELIKNAALKGVPFVAVRMAKAYVSMALFTAAVEAWNLFASAVYGGDDETDKRLKAARTKGMQFIVGVNEDGTIKTVPIQGAFYDFVDWFGLWTIADDIERIFENEDKLAELQKTASDLGKNATNKTFQMVTPIFKVPVEAATKQSLFPNVFNPVPIHDRMEYLFKSVTFGDEYNYLLTDKPTKESYWSRKFHNSFLREFDTEQLSYYAAKKLIGEYEGSATGGRNEVQNPIRKEQKESEYNFMLALRYGKYEEADKWLEDYISNGGQVRSIREKLKNMHPFEGVKKKAIMGEPVSEWYDLNQLLTDKNYRAQTHFGRQITNEDRFLLKEAMNYYDRINSSSKEFWTKRSEQK